LSTNSSIFLLNSEFSSISLYILFILKLIYSYVHHIEHLLLYHQDFLFMVISLSIHKSSYWIFILFIYHKFTYFLINLSLNLHLFNNIINNTWQIQNRAIIVVTKNLALLILQEFIVKKGVTLMMILCNLYDFYK
jgi:hypothetical protein